MPLPVLLRQLILASLITLGLTACGGSDNDNGPGPQPSSSSADQSSSANQSTSSLAASSSSAPADVEPAEFAFEPQANVELGAIVASNAIEVREITAPAPISVSGGHYSVNGGDYTESAGEVQEGDEVRVQLTAPESLDTEASATLTIGGISGTFTVTTVIDGEAPVADIAFPPPMSATGADTLTIRGRASDEHSGVAEVTLTVQQEEGAVSYPLEADGETGFAEWQQSIDLAPGNNRVSVQVRDDAGNELEEPVEVTVVHQAYDQPFPDDEQGDFQIRGMVFDKTHNRIILLGVDRRDDPEFMRLGLSVDLETGQRSAFTSNAEENEALDLDYLEVGAVDSENNRLVASNLASEALFEFDLETGLGSVLVEGASYDTELTFEGPEQIVKSPTEEGSYYVAAQGVFGEPTRLLKINVANGERKIVSGSSVGEGPEILGGWEMVVTKDETTAYVSRGRSLYKIDLLTGNRQEIPLDYSSDSFKSALGIMLAGKDEALHIFEISKGLMMRTPESGEWSVIHPHIENAPFEPFMASGSHYVEEKGYFFVAQQPFNAVYAYDLTTNEFVVVTRYSE